MKDKIGTGWGIDPSDEEKVTLLLEALSYKALTIGSHRYQVLHSCATGLWSALFKQKVPI